MNIVIIIIFMVYVCTQSDNETDSLFEVLIADASVIPRITRFALSQVQTCPGDHRGDDQRHYFGDSHHW